MANFELPINLKMSLVRHNMKTPQRKASVKFKSSCYEEMGLTTINFLCSVDVLNVMILFDESSYEIILTASCHLLDNFGASSQ